MASTSTDLDLTATVIGPDRRATCFYCGGAAGTGIADTVAIDPGPVFRRVVATCSLCAGLRVQGLEHDESWVLVAASGEELES